MKVVDSWFTQQHGDGTVVGAKHFVPKKINYIPSAYRSSTKTGNVQLIYPIKGTCFTLKIFKVPCVFNLEKTQEKFLFPS